MTIKYVKEKGIDPFYRMTKQEILLQKVFVRIRTFEGEWLLDENAGFPWTDWLSQRPLPAEEIADLLYLQISEIDEIESIPSVTIEKEMDSIKIDMRVNFVPEIEEERLGIVISESHNFQVSMGALEIEGIL